MHAVLTRLSAAPGRFDEVKALAADLVMPAYVEHAARGAYMLASCERAEVLVVVLYATRAEADSVESGEALQALHEGCRHLLACAPTSEAFEVLAGTTGRAPGSPLNGDILSFLSEISRTL
ncbi:MAG: hypothetical protein M3437_18290 [Chloroflexota bacterium]|nr:hypothetical protein [Chloroflexota bacterium]MDQ5864159.1 hypothetical protein [Chloroflexota bacterium]